MKNTLYRIGIVWAILATSVALWLGSHKEKSPAQPQSQSQSIPITIKPVPAVIPVAVVAEEKVKPAVSAAEIKAKAPTPLPNVRVVYLREKPRTTNGDSPERIQYLKEQRRDHSMHSIGGGY